MTETRAGEKPGERPQRARQGHCSGCGHRRLIVHHDGDQALCRSCRPAHEPCASCGRVMRIVTRIGGRKLCKTCDLKDHRRRRTCHRCQQITMLYHRDLCDDCVTPDVLRKLMTTADNAFRPELEAVIAALGTGTSTLVWSKGKGARQLLRQLGDGTGPVTHEELDRLPPSDRIRWFRKTLVAHGVLPARDENLIRLEKWIDRVSREAPTPLDGTLIRSYATWAHLHRLRQCNSGGTTTRGQIEPVFTDVGRVAHLAAWLHNRGSSITTCTQHDIDQWLADGPTTGNPGRNFLRWATHTGHVSNIQVPTRPQGPLRVEQTSDAERWTITRRLLHDHTINTSDRVAGLLVLLFGQSLTRISQLTTRHVHDNGTHLQLQLATTPVDILTPLDDLIRQLVRTRHGHAQVGHTDTHPWLFPGGMPGHPVSTVTLRRRLNRHGIKPRAARNATLITIAAQLPAAVISELLGISIATAAAWTADAGSSRNTYGAELARRTTSPRTPRR
jgi:hypothetical protein